MGNIHEACKKCVRRHREGAYRDGLYIDIKTRTEAR